MTKGISTTFAVILPTGDSCLATAKITALEPERSTGLDLRVSPNPVREVALAKLSLDIAGQVSAQLFSASGQLVKTVESGDWYAAGEHGLEIDANGMPPGVYFLQVQAGARQEQTKLIVLE